jgi:DNA-binding response OmpR family regulator
MASSDEQTSTILLVEDEPSIAFTLKLNLEAEGYNVVHASDGIAAVQAFSASPNRFCAVILDIMIPELDGFAVAKAIRKSDMRTGIFMLTARAGDLDRVRGLELGADDYITKPFHLQELLLRVKRMVERSKLLARQSLSQSANDAPANETKFTIGAFTLNCDALIFKGPLGNFEITALESDVLREFMTHEGKVLRREHLLEKVWKLKSSTETRTVDNFIVRLRRYVESDPKNPRILLSVRGRGYKFAIPE